MHRHHNAAKVAAAPPMESQRLLDQVRERIRYLHYIPKTGIACATPRASSVAIGTVLV